MGRQQPPSEQPKRSLEEHLAAVIEGEGTLISGAFDSPIYGGEGIYVSQEPNIIQLNRPRRKRRRVHARRPVTVEYRLPSGLPSQVSVGLSEQPNGQFKVSNIRIRYEDHPRSPFVVSLRGMSLTNDRTFDDERVSFSEANSFEIEPGSVPSISMLESLATDLYLHPHRIEEREQFTSDSIRRSALAIWMNQLASGWRRMMRSVRKSFERTERPVVAAFDADEPKAHRVFPIPSFLQKKETESYVLEVEDDISETPRIILDLDIDASEEEYSPSASVRAPQPRFHIIRSLATLSLLILIAMLPANVIRLVRDLRARQAAVAAASSDAIGALGGLNTKSGLAHSIEALRVASSEFRNADHILSETNALAVGLSRLLPSTHGAYATARSLMEIGEKTTTAAQLLAQGIDKGLSGSASPLERIAAVRAYAQGALPLLEDAATAFSTVDSSYIPEKERDKVTQLGMFVEDGRNVLRDVIGMSDLMTTVLGKSGQRRYLLIFQNPAELRATGGFMGSFAELDVDQGEMVRLEVPGGGTYDLEGQLVAQVIPPKPLQLIADRWEFQDSNWSPDFPTAAEKIRWFWSKSGGYSLDGVIAVNATMVEKMLVLTGPIEVPELGKTITSENFTSETQKAVELEYDRTENKPKKILSLLAPRMLERIKQLDSEGMLKLVSIISDSIEQKDIQIALTEEQENVKAQSFGWSGRIKQTKGDSLAIIGSNVAGQKTDAVIKEHAEQKVKISADGRITDYVSLTRTHTGKKGDVFTGVRNVEYFRFYVPRGSTLVEASGFDVIPATLFKKQREDAKADPDIRGTEGSADHTPYNVSVWDEGDRTVIGGWVMLDPGLEETISVSYRLPFTASDLRERLSEYAGRTSDGRTAYELLLTSQSGKPDRTISVSVETPKTWNAHWIREASSQASEWNRDRVISALFETTQTQP